MVGTKSRGYSNLGRLSEGEYSMPFFSTRHSPTYKINNLNMTLYAILSVNGHGESHLSCAFFVVNKDKNTLADMLKRFKDRNPNWTGINTVITDEDMTERLVFKLNFPQVQLQICLYHTLCTFSREVTLEKLQIKSSERKQSLKLLEKLAYSNDDEDYNAKYAEFCRVVPSRLQKYFKNNWHGIKAECVRGLKSVHLSNDTTNRVDSFFSKLKIYFSPRSSLKERFKLKTTKVKLQMNQVVDKIQLWMQK